MGIGTLGNSDPQKYQGTIDFYLTTTDGKAVPVHVFILDQCTGKLPMAKPNVGMIAELAGKKLADPAFHEPAPIDMILGIALFNALMLDERVRCGPVVLSETRLGRMLTGVAEFLLMLGCLLTLARYTVPHFTMRP